MCMKRGGFMLFLLAALAVSAARATNVIRVMSFNLRYASAAEDAGTWKQWNHPSYSPQRREFVVRILTNRQPDLVGFQEGEDTQLDYLAASLPAHYAFQRQLPSGGSGAENAAFMWNTNTLELLDRGAFSLGTSPGGGYWNNAPGSNFNPYLFFPDMGLGFPRLALWGRFRLRVSGQQFYFYTTHFDFNSAPQVNSAALITSDAQARGARIPASPLAISVGDYNSTQNNNDWRLFTGDYTSNGVAGDFTDSWWQTRGNWTNSGTIHGYSGGIRPASDRIDWILHRGGFVATQMVIVTDSVTCTNLTNSATATMYPSDHYPVLAWLKFPAVAADFDRDGLPDAAELATTNCRPADPDTDNDGLLDGEEDLNGNGTVDGGETDPAAAGNTQKPTDIRHYQMDGIRDYCASLLATHGLDLYWRFDGRYLYVATQDAGEGSDHFVFVATTATEAVAAPWAKAGHVARWVAYLADENDNAYAAWHDAAGARITNLFAARAAAYYQNGGCLEGVIDLAQLFGAGFTSAFYLAAGPYGTADGGALYAPAQVPGGNGDGNLLGTNEYIRIEPGDRDRDGISDYADPDQDGDGLPDAWETAYGISCTATGGADGAQGDVDGDRADNYSEYAAATNPTNAADFFRIAGGGANRDEAAIGWTAVHRKVYQVWRANGGSYSNTIAWQCVFTNSGETTFPAAVQWFTTATSNASGATLFRLSVTP